MGVGGGNNNRPAGVSEPNQGEESVLMAGASREQWEVGVWSVVRGVGAPGGYMVGEGQQGPHGGFESQSRVRRMPVVGLRWGGDH